jgi:hypothetical protein
VVGENKLKVWDMPVTVRLKKTGTVILVGPRDAVAFMDSNWPSEPGFLFKTARQKCADDAGRLAATDMSRKAFRAAAAEAGILPMREQGNVLKL